MIVALMEKVNSMSEEELRILLVRIDNLENFCLALGYMLTESEAVHPTRFEAMQNMVTSYNDTLFAMGLDTDPRMFDDGI